MNRIQLEQGVFLNEGDASKFKSSRVSITFVWPARRENATAEALMALVMERGCASCPDMTELSKKLAAWYGAALSVDLSLLGANRVLTVSVAGLQDAYALAGEALGAAYAQMAADVAFAPYLPGGVFDGEALQIEREQLRERLESEMNEKRSYCIRQARRRFFGDSPEGIERWGYLDELDSLTPECLTRAFWNMVETAQIEIMVQGADAAAVRRTMQAALASVKRKPAALVSPSAMPRRDTLWEEEPMDTAQGKLCLLFTAGVPVENSSLPALRVAVSLLGGTATSRLFLNVREKQSLCYYCSASGVARSGLLCIDSGVEHAKAASARAAVLHELELLRTGPIAPEELTQTKRAIITALRAVEDTLSGTESWYFNEILRGTFDSPQEAEAAVEAVTEQQVREVLNRFTLSVSYTIVRGGEAE